MRWVEGTFNIGRSQVIAVDGKTARGSRDSYRGQAAIHLVSAFAHESGLLLGQRKVAEKSNEIMAVPELLKTLFIKGSRSMPSTAKKTPRKRLLTAAGITCLP
jgi:hypothetical protein